MDKKNENEIDENEPQPKQTKNEDVTNIPTTVEHASVGALKCIGILPGICGTYAESSDSEKSTDTEDEYDFSGYDWIGRKKSLKQTNCEQ